MFRKSKKPLQLDPSKPRRIIKRSKNKTEVLYFDADTQAAIVEYQTADSQVTRNKLYLSRIMPAFEKLVENLINIHRFSGLHDTYDDLKHDCVSFLFETIGKFDQTRGTKAFSYFNVVAKNWLIIKTKKKSCKTKKDVSLDDPDSLSNSEMRMIEDHYSVQSQDVLLEKKKTAQTIIKTLYNIREHVRTENELTCINSIITVFESIDDLDILTKSAILLYVRELSGLSPKQLTTSLQTIKKHYTWVKEEAREEREFEEE
jgi:hypothetical protein